MYLCVFKKRTFKHNITDNDTRLSYYGFIKHSFQLNSIRLMVRETYRPNGSQRF